MRRPSKSSTERARSIDRELHEHLQRLWACRRCPAVEGLPVTGATEHPRVMLVGQAPGPREQEARRPFAWTAGRRLFEWFARIGADEETVRQNIWITSAIRCFPGRNPSGSGDRVPFPDEIDRCSEWLDSELDLLRPELVIAVGALAAGLFLERRSGSLTDLVGHELVARRGGFSSDLVVLPHPSGRSTWLNSEENRARLERSLEVIARHPAFRGIPAAVRKPSRPRGSRGG